MKKINFKVDAKRQIRRNRFWLFFMRSSSKWHNCLHMNVLLRITFAIAKLPPVVYPLTSYFAIFVTKNSQGVSRPLIHLTAFWQRVPISSSISSHISESAIKRGQAFLLIISLIKFWTYVLRPPHNHRCCWLKTKGPPRRVKLLRTLKVLTCVR